MSLYKNKLIKISSAILLGASLSVASLAIDTVLAPSTVEAADDQLTQEYINKLAETARTIGQEHGIYASVLLAQAVVESNSGTSGLNTDYNNIFGVKGVGDGSVDLLTWEDNGFGQAYNTYSAFRTYDSYERALEDYASLMTSTFSSATKENSATYSDATAALTGTYATDTAYGAKLNAVIEQFNLTQFDEPLPENETSSENQENDEELVYNEYRGKYTTQEVLDGDERFAAYKARLAEENA